MTQEEKQLLMINIVIQTNEDIKKLEEIDKLLDDQIEILKRIVDKHELNNR